MPNVHRFVVSSFLFVVAGAAGVSVARDAKAYCRTYTQAADADWDAATRGCFKPTDPKAKLLFWRNHCVGFSLQQDASRAVTLDQATAGVTQAFARWSGASCAGGGTPSVEARDNGPVACTEVRYNTNGAPNNHVIVFRDTPNSWCLDDPETDPAKKRSCTDKTTLALTTVTFNTDTGELYDADMELNSYNVPIVSTAGKGFDFDSIVTHETGHFLGLAHSEETSAIMYAHYQPGGNVTLGADDVAGICAIYPPDGQRTTSDGNVDQGPCDATPRGGFISECGQNGAPPSSSGGCSAAAGTAGGSLEAAFAVAALALGAAGRRRRAFGGAR